jgi:2-oxo-4-hydroxy-4-carboxy--5-ureidoimidazoline (OHCU) decarboxylase
VGEPAAGPDAPERLVDPATLGSLDRDDLAAAMRPLWEDPGPLAGALVGRRVASWEEHVEAARASVAGMDDETRVALLRGHPRLGAPPGQLAARSPRSWEEQGGWERAFDIDRQLEDLNVRYEERFGFPFVEWVAGRPLSAIVPVITERLQRDRATELRAGCEALVAIAADRLTRLGRELA